MSENLDRCPPFISAFEPGSYEPPRLLELGDIALLTGFDVSVRVP